MSTLERSALFLVIYLTIFFNIERVDLGQANLIDMSSVIYVLVLFALAIILAVPSITRLRLPLLLILWVGLYLGIRFALLPFYERSIWGGVYTYLTITEISLSSIALILGYQVRRQLNDFAQAVENVTLAGLTHRIKHKEAAQDDIQREFLRSRRHNYPLSLMVVQPDPTTVKASLNRSILDIQRAMMARYATTNIMRLASNMMRRTDLIVDRVIDKDSFVILLADTNADGAQLLAQRFRAEVDKAMGIKVNVGLAVFPEEGLTFEDLASEADGKIQARLTEGGTEAPILEAGPKRPELK